MSLKEDKITSLLTELAAAYLNKESSRESLITVTRATTSKDRRKATIFVTILPEDKEKRALEFLSRKEGELRQFVKKNSDLRIIPDINFALDLGEKSRQRLDELSQ